MSSGYNINLDTKAKGFQNYKQETSSISSDQKGEASESGTSESQASESGTNKSEKNKREISKRETSKSDTVSDVGSGVYVSDITDSYRKILKNKKVNTNSGTMSIKGFDNISNQEVSDFGKFNDKKGNKNTNKKTHFTSKYFGKDISKFLNDITEDNNKNISLTDNWLKDTLATFLPEKGKLYGDSSIGNNKNKKEPLFVSSNKNILSNMRDFKYVNPSKKMSSNVNKRVDTAINRTVSYPKTTVDYKTGTHHKSNSHFMAESNPITDINSLANIHPLVNGSPMADSNPLADISPLANSNPLANINPLIDVNSVVDINPILDISHITGTNPIAGLNPIPGIDHKISNAYKNKYNNNASIKETNYTMHGINADNHLEDYHKNKEKQKNMYSQNTLEREISDPTYFEHMVGDLRITFLNWLKKTQLIFIREKDKLLKDRKELEMERKKIYKEIENKRILEEEKIKDERKKLDLDMRNSYNQLKKEKEENRKRFDEERLRFLKDIDKMKLLLNLEKEKYYQEYKKFEVEKKRIVDANIATETIVDINIGGVVFETSRHTLTQQKNSFIEQILSGRHVVARDKHGRIFLDRDSELFRIILNFLRNPLHIPVPKNLNESESLLKETEFYGINFLPFPLAFCIGGFDGIDYLNSVELLDISQHCWRMCTPMITKKAYFGSAVLNNFLYVFGGNNYDYKALFETEVYDRLRDVWFVGSKLNIPRRNNAGVTLNGRIYSIGGYDGTSIIPNVEAYDNRMKTWIEVAPLNVPRSSAMTVAIDDKIYVIGGTNGQRLKSIEVYDEKMNVWEKFPHYLIEARSSGSAFSYLNQIYVMGGVDNEHNVLCSVEQYHSMNKRWQFLNNLPENRMNFAAATLSDTYIVTGGENGSVLNSCYIFSPDTNQWQLGPPLLVPRFGHSVLVANL